MEYSWCRYYQRAYEEEKRKNTLLAGKVADAEGKREELQAKYAAICGNPLYRMLRPFSLVKKGCKKAVRLVRALPEKIKPGRNAFLTETGGAEGEIAGEMPVSYEERLACQRDAYGQWMKEEEPEQWRQSREALQKGRKAGVQRKALVVTYQELAGIRSLLQIPGIGRAEERAENAERDKSGETGLKEKTALPDILLFAENPADLDEKAVAYIEEWFSSHRETKLFYGAEDHRYIGAENSSVKVSASGKDFPGPGEEKGKRSFPWFKPCWSPDTLLGFFYFGSYFAVDLAWAEKTLLAGDGDAKRNLYDFVLRLLKPYYEERKRTVDDKKKLEIVCTDLILYHQSSQAVFETTPDREYFLHTGEMREEQNPEFWGFEKAYAALKQNFINKLHYREGFSQEGKAAEISSFSYQTLHPAVWSVVPERKAKREGEKGVLISVVIPSKDHPELLKKCIGSFLERTSFAGIWGGVEFIVVDNGSSEENRQTIQDFLDGVRSERTEGQDAVQTIQGVWESVTVESRYLYRPMPFNFSAMCNLGAKEARGEYILLLNDDMEIIEENWLRILLGQALLPGVGAVGAKLWYPGEERIQHAGITNMHIGPSHKLVTFPDERTYYYGHNTVAYNMIAVTAACLLVKKSVYQEAGGLDEEMAVSYNDVDFCFKTVEAGYRNVQRNDAVLLHHESASRGLDEESAKKWVRLLQEKEKLYKKHPLFYKNDPYYSEQLADNAPDYRIGYQYPYERPLLTADPLRQEGKETLRKCLSGAVMLTVERAGNRHKIHLEEPDILETEGWCYILGEDNAGFERWLILEAEQGDFYYRIPVKERLRPDVEAILPQQKHIGLSGFTCRILKESIVPADYRVGMLYRNLQNGKIYYQYSDKVMKEQVI